MYDVTLDRPQTQRLTVTFTFEPTEAHRSNGFVDVRMPAWRPGRYSILDPAGGVVRLEARDGDDEPLDVHKTDKATWRVSTADAEQIAVEYELYANSLGLRTRHVDDSHAFLSGSSVFVYVEELRGEPLEVRIDAPASWRIASGLEAAANRERTLVAPDFDVLIDSPIEVGEHDRIDFTVAGKPHEFVIWPRGRAFDRDRIVADVSAIVEEQLAIFGSLPYERYVFLLHAGAGAGGGTEHLNSTIMQVPADRLAGSLRNDDDWRRLLGLISHEFFHTWNVKQMRPANLAPYDLQRENYSTLFWVAEGTTSYYDSLTLARTGLDRPDDYLEELGELVDGSRKRPGTGIQSLSDSSFDAWVKFNVRSPDSANTTVSFYSQGALASLYLDLRIREASAGEHDLDEVLRALYERFPLGDGGYTRTDLEDTLRDVTGRDWSDFFLAHVDGVEPLPLEDAFRTVGLELWEKPRKRRGGARPARQENGADEGDRALRSVAEAGASLTERGGRAVVTRVRAGSAFFDAGIVPDDEIVAVAGRRVEADEWEEIVESFAPGDEVEVHFVRHGLLRSLVVTLGAEDAADWRLRRLDDEEVTSEQKAAYAAWMKQPWPEKGGDGNGDAPDDDDGDVGGSPVPEGRPGGPARDAGAATP